MSDTGKHNHPDYLEDGSLDYAYTSGFKKVFPSISERVLNQLNDKKNLMSSTINPGDSTSSAIAQLSVFISMAKSAEINFLKTHGINMGIEPNWGQIITGLNIALGSEESFKRNILLLQQIIKSDGSLTDKGYKDIIRDGQRSFKSLLQEEVYNAFNSLSLNADLNDVAQTAVLKAIERLSQTQEQLYKGKIEKGKRGDTIQPFSELYGQLDLLKQNAPFLMQSMNELFKLNEYLPQVKEQLLQGEVKSAERLNIVPKFGNSRYQGTLQEILDTVLHDNMQLSGSGENVTWTMHAYQTGPHNFKPDVILSSVTLDYEDAYNKAKGSLSKDATVREKGILTMQNLIDQFYKNAKSLKDSMVIISDKEYVINQTFKEGNSKRVAGFGGQSNVSLNNLNSLFAAFHIESGDIDNLIDYFKNVGNAMIGGHVDQDILKVIASKIAYFLFDDIEMSYPGDKANIIHIFNLSGIYVPLSFVLDGVKQGLLKVEAKLRGNTYHNDFVTVKFKSSPEKVEGWSQDKFDAFRDARMDNTTLTVHFLEGFAQAITSEINF